MSQPGHPVRQELLTTAAPLSRRPTCPPPCLLGFSRTLNLPTAGVPEHFEEEAQEAQKMEAQPAAAQSDQHQALLAMDSSDSQAMREEAKRPALFSLKSIRLRIALLMMFGMFCSASLRNNLGVTIVCMVNATAMSSSAPERIPLIETAEPDECPGSVSNRSFEESGYDGDLLWDSHTQGIVFSAVGFGSLVTLLPAGMIADQFGPKHLIFWALLSMAINTYISPIMANYHPWAFAASRFVLGASNGFIMPSMTAVAARWFVPDERSTMNALYTSGIQVCGIVLGLTTPMLCESKLLGGWPLVYYVLATLTVCWGVLWCLLATNHAEKNKKIGDVEKLYITENVVVKKNQKQTMFPIRKAILSMPFWAVMLIRVTLITQQKIMMSYTASFIRDILKADLTMNGLYTSLPYIAQLISKNLVSAIADYLKRQRILSHTTSVRLFQSIASFGSALTFLGLAYYADCNHVALGVTLLVFKNIFTSFVSPGMHTSALSIAPLHSGGLHSVTMFVAFLTSSASPILVGMILQHNTKAEWSLIFHFLTTLNVLSGIFFAIFGSAEAQEWSLPTGKTFPAPTPTVSEVDTKESLQRC